MSQDPQQKLVHNVFFALKDSSPAAIETLIADCWTYLSGHPGEAFFAAGPPVADLARPVNVRDFHVALLVVFANRQAHDDYQTAPRHLDFIARNRENWASVRVFDSYSK